MRDGGEVADFMASHQERVVVKPCRSSGSTDTYVLDTPAQAVDVANVVSAQPYEVEEIVNSAMHHVDVPGARPQLPRSRPGTPARDASNTGPMRPLVLARWISPTPSAIAW